MSVNPDTGTVSPDGITFHNKGAKVTIAATAKEPYQFSYWDGPVTEQKATTTIVMDSDKVITAYFGM